MKILVKKLQGGECNVEVDSDTYISELKQQIAEKLHISVKEQKLLLLGRTLADNQMIKSYPTIKDGSKLNLIIKKPDGLYEVSVKYFKQTGMSETEAINTTNRWLKIIQDKFDKLSWDDIDRLALDCMLDEKGLPPLQRAEQETEGDDLYSI